MLDNLTILLDVLWESAKLQSLLGKRVFLVCFLVLQESPAILPDVATVDGLARAEATPPLADLRPSGTPFSGPGRVALRLPRTPVAGAPLCHVASLLSRVLFWRHQQVLPLNVADCLFLCQLISFGVPFLCALLGLLGQIASECYTVK